MLGRIGATITAIELRLLNQLNDATTAAATSALRLATGEKINAPRDNPTGFIALSEFRADKKRLTAALANVNEASSLVSQTQLTLDQIRTQLETIQEKALEDEDQGLTADQRAANQVAIDTAIDAISSLAGSSIDGRRVLDGSAAFEVSGVNNAQIQDLFPISLASNTSKTLSGAVTSTATRATLTHVEGAGTISNAATFTLEGTRGSASISVANGESLATVATRINQESHVTGVTATVSGGTNLAFNSVEYGSDTEISITTTSGVFTGGADIGSDAVATINGITQTGEGNKFTIADNGFLATVEFKAGFTGAFDPITISGDALTFSLSTDLAHRSVLAIPALQPALLGGLSGTLDQLKSGGSLSGLGTNVSQALRVIDEALGDLTRVEGLVDGFADSAIESSETLLNDLADNVDDAIDDLNQVDEDEEELLQSRNEALASNAIAGLAVLDQQRNSIVALIQKIAGLA